MLHPSNLFPLPRVLKVYALAYLSCIGPKILSQLVALARRRTSSSDAFDQIYETIKQASAANHLPAACAVLVGGSSLLRPLLRTCLLLSLSLNPEALKHLNPGHLDRASTFISSLIAASATFSLLNKREKSPPINEAASVSRPDSPEADEPQLIQYGLPKTAVPPSARDRPREDVPTRAQRSIPLAGETIDLTLFTVVRAADALILAGMSRRSAARQSRFSASFQKGTPPGLFILACAAIMHAWFYAPDRLPRAYVAWISRAAELDPRLLLALRQCRYGNFIYGKETGIAPLLGSMAKDCGLPEVWGDPAKTIPVPCELVHHGMSSSCELYGAKRFCRGWWFAFKMYGSLQLIVLTRRFVKARKGRLRMVATAFLDAARSSSFLGAFIAFFYYGVCLARTRVGPRLFNRKTVSPQMWDGGMCITVGCLFCGWSILLEQSRRRIEMLLFVLPRALSVWLPRRYDAKYRWREHITFSISTAILLTAAAEKPTKVRGVLGTVLQNILSG